MALTQEFKDNCEKILLDWQSLQAKNWGGTEWKDLADRVRNGKDKILKDPFFLSFKTRTTEEQKWMWKRIEFWYSDGSIGASDNKSLVGCESRLAEDNNEKTTKNGRLAVDFYQLKADFWKMVNVDKWEDTNDKKDITLAWLQEADRKDAERDLTKIPYPEITKQFIENNKKMQEIKKSFEKVITNLSEFNEEKFLYLLPYQLADKNWVLLCRTPASSFYIFTAFKDTEKIEDEIKTSIRSQLPKSYIWKGILSNKLLDRKPETAEESFIWSLSFIWGQYEFQASPTGSEWDSWDNIIKNTQKSLIDDTRKQYWDLLPNEFKGQGRKKKLEDLQNQLNQALPNLFDKDGKLDEKKLAEIKNLQNNQEKHKPEDLKPVDLPTDWKEQITKKNEWENNFPGQSASKVKIAMDELNILVQGEQYTDEDLTVFKELGIEDDQEKKECIKECYRLLEIYKKWINDTYNFNRLIRLSFAHIKKDGTKVNYDKIDGGNNNGTSRVDGWGNSDTYLKLDRYDFDGKFRAGIVWFTMAHELSY